MKKPIPLSDRLDGRYNIDPDTGCWLWTGDKRNGYGSVWVNGVRRYAHRAVYELHNGSIPKGRHICHTCDCPPCINPRHLFVGTQAENVQDMWQKGRGVNPPLHFGERHHKAKLTENDARTIRQRCAAGETQRKVAADYGIYQSTVGAIVRGKTWAAVA